MSKIFIDAGHGGHDPGALGSRSQEKDNVLKVANRLKTLLENNGYAVRMSRSTDVFIGLSERARLANVWGADYFVSLHNNAAMASATGFETFIYNGAVQNKTTGFQNAVHTAIINGIGIRDRGKKRANFAVLRETIMPAVLIEYAFISNVNDENILISEVEKLAQLTAKGIVNYVGGVKQALPKPVVSKPSTTKLAVDGYMGPDTIRALQRYFGTPGDGVLSRPSLVIKAMQKWLGTTKDGYISEPYSNMVAALQRRYGTPVDGRLSRPSLVIKELQRKLNNGKL